MAKAGALGTGSILADGWLLYRLLWRRSIVTAALIFAPYTVFLLLIYAGEIPEWTDYSPLGFVMSFAGPALVQGALILTVHDLHRGVRPRGALRMVRDTLPRLLRLIGASMLYSLGVGFGLILLIVPGLWAAAQWALWAPMIMLKELKIGEARRRSGAAVAGHTKQVIKPLVVLFLIGYGLPILATVLLHPSNSQHTVFVYGWSVLTAPFHAHVLNVLYYRLVERKAVLPRAASAARTAAPAKA